MLCCLNKKNFTFENKIENLSLNKFYFWRMWEVDVLKETIFFPIFYPNKRINNTKVRNKLFLSYLSKKIQDEFLVLTLVLATGLCLPFTWISPEYNSENKYMLVKYFFPLITNNLFDSYTEFYWATLTFCQIITDKGCHVSVYLSYKTNFATLL